MPSAASISQTKSYLAGLEQQARATEERERQIMAASREAYRWGRNDRRTQHFQPAWRSADSAILESQDLMGRRVRNQAINEPQIKRIRDAFEDLVVGPGVQTFADPFEPTLDLTDLSEETLDPLLAYALESDDLFDEWFLDPLVFDAAGKRSGPDVQRMAMGECVERGGILLVRTGGAKGSPMPLAYQIVEYDQLDTSVDREATADQNKIVNGIELDAQGREVAYHIYDEHPFDDFSSGSASTKSSPIRAERVIHLCLFRRPSQSLGVNFVHACAQPSFDRDKFMGAEIQTAAKAAVALLVHYMKNPKAGGNLGLLDDGDGLDEFGNEELKLGGSPVAFRVGADDEVELVENLRPTASADSFIGILDHDIAAAAGLSYYTLSGRYDKTNFTSLRGALLAEDSHFRPLQNWFARQVALPIRREFQRRAIGLGMLKSVSAKEYAAHPRRFNRFDALGAGRDLLDPEAETNAAAGKLRACLTTLKLECARRGLHWIRVLRQVSLENRLLSILEISLDLSKGQGGQVVGNTRSKRDQQDAAETAEAEGAAK